VTDGIEATRRIVGFGSSLAIDIKKSFAAFDCDPDSPRKQASLMGGSLEDR